MLTKRDQSGQPTYVWECVVFFDCPLHVDLRRGRPVKSVLDPVFLDVYIALYSYKSFQGFQKQFPNQHGESLSPVMSRPLAPSCAPSAAEQVACFVAIVLQPLTGAGHQQDTTAIRPGMGHGLGRAPMMVQPCSTVAHYGWPWL